MTGQHMLVLLLATLVLANDNRQEAVMERPLTSARDTTTGNIHSTRGEKDEFKQSRAMDSELLQRQGPMGQPDMFEMTVNALNPMPYFLGGLRGVREVVRQRFFPWRGMMIDNFSRVLPRRPPSFPRFRGTGPGPGGSNSPGVNGVPFRNGGGFLHDGVGFRGGGHTNKFRDMIKPLTTDDPSGNHHTSGGQGIEGNAGFETPRPDTVITSSGPSQSFRTENPLNSNNLQTNGFTISTQGTPTTSFGPSGFQTSTHNSNGFNSLNPTTEKTKVISIEIPKEFNDLSVLEVSMKSDGNVIIGPKNSTSFASSLSTRSPHGISGTFSSPFPPFRQNVIDNNFISHVNPEPRVNNPANIHVGVSTNPNNNRGSVTCMNSMANGKVNSIQDVLCMQNLENTRNFNGNSIKPFGNNLHSLNMNNGIPSPFARENPVPQFSANYIHDKQNVNHIYFVPLSVPSPQSNIVPQFSRTTSPIRQHVNSISPNTNIKPKGKDPNVFYIDITLPGNDHAEPTVKHRTKRSLQFDGWYPMDVSNPMSDEPTLGYKPPPLERVHFGEEPVTDKPMYPVRPKNPTVFVVRAEPQESEVHSVYGTENIEYFHIHPQTNTIKAFRSPDQSVGAIQFVPPPQFGGSKENSQPPSGSTTESFSGLDKERDSENSDQRQRPPNKDDLYGDIKFYDEATQYDSDYNIDMEASFSEHAPVVVRPYHYNNRDQSGFQRYRYRSAPSRRRFDVIDVPPSRKPHSTRTSRPALYELLGNVKYESQIEETPYLGSASDTVRGSIFREVPPPNFLPNQGPHRYSNLDVYQKNIPRSGPRGPTYRNTDFDDISSHPWYLIDTKSERRREPSIASYIHPETRLGEEKVHYRPFGPISYVSKGSQRTRQRDSIYNPHLDDHMNSYKPSTSLVANSLSELLQIFKYTQTTENPGRGGGDEPITLVREFRYTLPTEETPTTISSFDDNVQPDKRQPTPPPATDNKASKDTVTASTEKIQFDAVADTNSLDGYLFSDSEASPEYAHPEVKPNIVIIEGKDIGNSKGLTKGQQLSILIPTNSTNQEGKTSTLSAKEEKQAFENLEIIYPGPVPKISTFKSPIQSSPSWPLYIIHEGHSKVKVFGANNTKDKNTAKKNFEVVNLTEEPTTFITETYAPETTTSSPFTSTTHAITTTHITVDVNSTFVPIANSKITSTSSTHELHDKPLSRERDDYEYYYYDEDEYGPEIPFRGDYIPDGWEHSPLNFQGPPLPPTAYEFAPPVPSQRSLEGGDLIIRQSSDGFPQVFQERLPPTGDALPRTSDSLPLLPALALTRDQLSVARPVFYTKRQQRSDINDKDASVSHPFEYVSQLRQLSREKRSLIFHEEKNEVEVLRLSESTSHA